MEHDKRQVAVSVIMPTTGWQGTLEPCARRILEIIDRSSIRCELVVSLDGQPEEAPDWLRRPDVTVVCTGRRSGPAAARNLAAGKATGEILLFADSDVVLAHDAIARIHARLTKDSGLAGVFGTYDDRPAAPGLVSRFRNLLHHHTHSTHPGPVKTFWAGCGAMRRSAFEAAGGFPERYGRPSIEDIELGVRVTSNGQRIEIDRDLQCTHLKRWTLASMIRTDIVHRAIPWSRLMLEQGRVPVTLNVDWRGRASGVCATAGALSLIAALAFPWALIATAILLAVPIALNAGFFRLCAAQGGIAFALGCVPLHLLYLTYSTVTFSAVAIGRNPIAALLAAGLLCAAVTLFADPGVAAWVKSTDYDLQQRQAEYALFRSGVYPNARIEAPPEGVGRRYGVYPAYAYPMFAALFEPGGLLQARAIVQLLSAGGLVAIGIYGMRLLRPYGLMWAPVGALAAAAVSNNRSAFVMSQFSLISAGFTALQVMSLQRGRPMLAGACWAMSMLKPQMGIAFGVLFLLNRQWRGLAFGVCILLVLGLGALWWTGISPAVMANDWFVRQDMRFTREPGVPGPGWVSRWLEFSPRTVHYVSLAIGACALAFLLALSRRIRVPDLLVPAAACAVLGRLLIYHRSYDQLMLFPLLLACLVLALRMRTAVSIAMAAAVGLTLWGPVSFRTFGMEQTWIVGVLQAITWVVAAAYAVRQQFAAGGDPSLAQQPSK